MTDNVIPLKAAEPMVLVCGCGCRTFEINDDETFDCANCGETSPESAAWVKSRVVATADEPNDTFKVMSISADTPEFLLRRILKDMSDVIAVSIMRSESASTWSLPMDTPDRVEWLDRRLADIRSFILRGKSDGDVERPG